MFGANIGQNGTACVLKNNTVSILKVIFLIVVQLKIQLTIGTQQGRYK